VVADPDAGSAAAVFVSSTLEELALSAEPSGRD
jgi:hypothetical protein